MKQTVVFLFLFLLPVPAVAQSAEYDLSCENVAKITIIRGEGKHWNVDSPDGYFYVVGFDLTEAAAPAYREVRNTAPRKLVLDDGIWFRRPDLVVTAHGVPLRNDTPAQTAFVEDGINIGIVREEDAFEAARMVCPELVPDKVLIDGRWE